jgi:osmotically-inducible protein OsmY
MKTDIELRDDVLDELRWEPAVNEAEIGVAVKDGVVTLAGTVSCYAQKLESEHAVLRVPGVKALANGVRIKQPGSNLPTDTDIALAVSNALGWNVNVPDGRIQIMVEEGWVTLKGEVEWRSQKSAADTALRDLKGVKGVINEIDVKNSNGKGKDRIFSSTEKPERSDR